MKTLFTRLLLALGLALLAGCSPSPSPSSGAGSAQFTVSMRQSATSNVSDISRVTITTSAEDLSPSSVDLTRSNGVWGGIVGDIPAGSGRIFQAQAFDYWGTLRFEGTVSGITIEADQSSLVAILLQEVNSPPPYSNEAPVIDSLWVSSSTVLADGTLSLQATAHDPNDDDSFWYAWDATGGYFSWDSDGTATWQAPSSSGTYTLTLTVMDSGGTSSSLSLRVSVYGGQEGRAEISISYNGSPAVSSVSASRSPVEVGQTTTVSATASDSDGDELSYFWSASCEGTWDNTSSSTARFTPSSLPSGACNNCNLTVTISDNQGGQTTGTVALCVNSPSSDPHAPPRITRSYRSSDTATANQVITYEVAATDPEGASLSFSWSANAGTLGQVRNSGSNSSITWTAPFCARAGVSPAVTVTVTNTFGMTATRSFPITGLVACAPGSWAVTGSMASARHHHTATLLANGKVLVTGGYYYYFGTPTYLATAEVYDPATGTWSTTASMSTRRYHHTATLLPNGKVLVTGGFGSSSSLATAEVYDPATGTWSATGSMASARYHHTATLLPNGKVLVTGGYGSGHLATAEVYDPATGTWSTTGSMASSRYQHTATLLPNGKVLVTGGYRSSSVATAEVYDPATGTWSTTGTMASARYVHTATLLPNGKVLVVGGYRSSTPLATAELYDPSTGTWSATGSMLSARSSHTATLLPNGTVLAAGGVSYDANGPTAEIYDPATSTWSVTEAMTESRIYQMATLLSNGDVLIAGGYSYWNSSLRASELFTP
jgi:N-acetylneuraminic acid mutarotase